ncbi:head maturation protease, ClpP-related [Psychrobacter sp. JB193]|uniref:head maturation protease, ClpP-related n=1 Tax=Psychrobacter sp. JB193 TaxID=2024406 RepID=UPI000BAAD252|nr:head maturation protease, ClpP-related [Psychrobacter sp. JB193]PAT64061.1 peptidase [Psychrobacter sp. JB193]
MSKRTMMPKADFEATHDVRMPLALDRWNPDIKALDDDSENVINILEVIGYDWWTDGGITGKSISAQLKRFNGADIVVNINSPGGDVFEGLAIYNMLREYAGHVTVQVVGMAASAASFIAMAADEVKIARAGFFMIHNAWTGVGGNRNDMREVADFLEQIDATIADIYHVKSGMEATELSSQMDKETWINGKTAVETGMADSFLDSDVIAEQANNTAKERIAAHKLDLIMAQAGMSRKERRGLVKDLKSTPSATQPDATQNAGVDLSGLVVDLQNAIDSIKLK